LPSANVVTITEPELGGVIDLVVRVCPAPAAGSSKSAQLQAMNIALRSTTSRGSHNIEPTLDMNASELGIRANQYVCLFSSDQIKFGLDPLLPGGAVLYMTGTAKIFSGGC
jgi:hypothetical protein